MKTLLALLLLCAVARAEDVTFALDVSSDLKSCSGPVGFARLRYDH
jgi:hypothetical protein